MAKQLFKNRASSLLANTLNAGSTSITVSAGDGNLLFPAISAPDYALLTLEDANGTTEVVKAILRVGDTFTVTGGRGQEGTTAGIWTQNLTRVELRTTAGTMEKFVQRDGDNMTGTLAMAGFGVTNPVVSGASSRWTGGEIVAAPLRSAPGDASNELVITAGGQRPTIGGVGITLSTDLLLLVPVGAIIMWGRAAVDIPVKWKICDGAAPGFGELTTPDLRDRFIVASGPTRIPTSTTPAAATGTSGAGTAHTHNAQGTILSAAQGAVHGHEVWLNTVSGSGENESLLAAGTGLTGETDAGAAYFTNNGSGVAVVKNSLGGATHTHTVDNESVHTHVVPLVQPSSYALIFIMKVI